MQQPPNVIPHNDLERRLRMYLLDAVVREMPAGSSPYKRYSSTEALVFDQGHFWKPFRSPMPWRRDRMAYCYYYTLRFVLDMEGEMRYVEGFAIHPLDGEAVPHAWAVDRAGRVWDVVWPDPETAAYWGLVLPVGDVLKFWQMDEEHVGVLQREHLIGSPLLRFGELFPKIKKGQRR